MKKSVFKLQTIYSASSLATVVIFLACLWTIATITNFRFDVTQEKFYTLSEGSNNLITKLPQDTIIRVYFSQSAKNVPLPIKNYAIRVQDLLRQYVNAADGKITLETLDPQPDTDAELMARRYGIKPVPLGDGTEMFFGIAFFSGKSETAIPYIDPRREQFLEYDISEQLHKLLSKEQIKVGIISSLDMITSTPAPDLQAALQGRGDWAVVSELKKISSVEKLEQNIESIPEQIKVLVLHHPKDLPENTLKAIDRFVRKSGRLIVLVDPFSRFDLDRQYQTNNPEKSISSNIEKLFKAWEIEFDSSKVVGDLKFPTQINSAGDSISFPFFIQVGKSGLNKDSIITNNLKQLIITEPGSIRLRAGSSHRLEPLLETSTSTGTVQAEVARLGPNAMRQKTTSEKNSFTLAALVRGKFKSAFSDEKLSKTEDESNTENVVLVIGDTDFIADQNSVQRVQFANQIVLRHVNDNIRFFINSVEFLGGSEDLISIRSRSRVLRPFEKLVEIQEAAQSKWKSEEEAIQKALTETQRKLQEMQGARIEDNKLILTSEQQAEIEKFRNQESRMRKKLRDVRKNLREDIEQLGRRLTILNMTIVPLGVSIVGGIIFRKRAKRSTIKKKNM